MMAPGGERYADVVGTVDEQVGRYRALADVGRAARCSSPCTRTAPREQIERFAPVIAAFDP